MSTCHSVNKEEAESLFNPSEDQRIIKQEKVILKIIAIESDNNSDRLRSL